MEQERSAGHLIDSAQNNIRRFIVAQYEDKGTEDRLCPG